MYSVYLYPEHQETNGPQQDWCDSMMQSKVDSIFAECVPKPHHG